MSKAKKKSGKERSRHPRGIRPLWSGTLTFGLVNVPVELYPAQRSNSLAMRMLAPDGTPLSRRFYCPEHKVDVHPEHLVRGFQLEDGDYVIIRDEELEAASPRKSREIDLRQFVETDQIPQRLFERSYFLTPGGDSNKAYRLLAGAMEKTELAGIATFVMRGKEYLVAIISEGGVLRLFTLRFADEIRSPKDIGLPEQRNRDETAAKEFAKSIKKLSQSFLKGIDLRDHYLAGVEKLVKQKQEQGEGIVHVTDVDSEGENDDTANTGRGEADLLEVIRRSLKNTSRQSQDRTVTQGANGASSNGTASELLKLSKKQLYHRAQQLDIQGRSDMTKSELIDAIKKQK